MADQDKVRQLGRLLGAAARDHHEAHGAGPAPDWARWYAARIEGDIAEYVGFEPTVGQISAWLTEADRRFRSEQPDTKWPYFYAELILDSSPPPLAD